MTESKRRRGRPPAPAAASRNSRVRDYRTLTLRVPEHTRALMDAVMQVEEHESLSWMLDRVLNAYLEFYVKEQKPNAYELIRGRAADIRDRMQRDLNVARTTSDKGRARQV